MTRPPSPAIDRAGVQYDLVHPGTISGSTDARTVLDHGIHATFCDTAMVQTQDVDGTTHDRIGLLLGGRVNNTDETVAVGFILGGQDVMQMITDLVTAVRRVEPDAIYTFIRSMAADRADQDG